MSQPKTVRIHVDNSDHPSSPPGLFARDSPPFKYSDITDGRLSHLFNGVAAKKPLDPGDVRKAFLKYELDKELREALRNERWYRCICRKPGCERRSIKPSRCPGGSDVCVQDEFLIDLEFLELSGLSW
ncbi:hypothetical protein TESG_07297 [Trichophyton tonsurans CBS 112818]|uniref:Uncharacterized protein n=1 Tax=Trichophyton tonsurans (strain CBS 112818) TaxID=647933 RepID=F2S8S0_TRIT1|nr:hypothetical protein TESG_07297 [Trichophyton tonsurans CBS 112818]